MMPGTMGRLSLLLFAVMMMSTMMLKGEAFSTRSVSVGFPVAESSSSALFFSTHGRDGSIQLLHFQPRRNQNSRMIRRRELSPKRLPRASSSSGSTTSLAAATTSLPSVFATAQASLHQDPFFCLTAILLLSTFGLKLEQQTQLGKALSAPLATMALALLVANLGIVPFHSPIYSSINRFLVPLAVPLLLFDSNLRRILQTTRTTLLLSFAVGAIATVLGTFGALAVLPLSGLAASGIPVACALAARHIGGAINFVAVAETLQIPGTLVSAAIAADNVVVALYFAVLFALAKPGEEEEETTTTTTAISTNDIQVKDPESLDESASSNFSLSSLAMASCVASGLVTLGGILTRYLLPKGTSSLPLTSVLTVLTATLFPQQLAPLRPAGQALGILLIQMFFAASGAAGSIRLVLQKAPSLFAFSALQIAIHFGVLMGLGRRLLRLPANELYLASNANVGGPTTAAAMAQAKGWKQLIVPALLIGILGYASATAIALALFKPLLWMQQRII